MLRELLWFTSPLFGFALHVQLGTWPSIFRRLLCIWWHKRHIIPYETLWPEVRSLSQPVWCDFYARAQNCEKRLLASSCLSACVCVILHGTARLPWNRFSLNLTFEYFSIILRENSSFIHFGQEWRVFWMKFNVQFWSCLVQFFLKWEIFRQEL